jgi:hypothetical protein
MPGVKTRKSPGAPEVLPPAPPAIHPADPIAKSLLEEIDSLLARSPSKKPRTATPAGPCKLSPAQVHTLQKYDGYERPDLESHEFPDNQARSTFFTACRVRPALPPNRPSRTLA